MSPTFRHPSESWDLSVGDRSTRPMKTPAFAGVTTGLGTTGKTSA
jgi:hypothetical protein